MFACSPLAVIGMDPDGTIENANRSAESLFRLASSAIVGRSLAEVAPPERRELVQQALQRVAASRQNAELELEIQPDGSPRRVLSVTLTAVLDDQDRVGGLAAWIQDITHRRELETKLVETEKIASLGTLASGVAHYFNNIMGGVAILVDVALTSSNPDSTRRALEKTAQAAVRVGEITRNLLTFAEKDKILSDLADITEVILTFAHLVEKRLAEKNIKLQLHLQAAPVVEVVGSRFHQMLENLLDNAENAMPQGGTVRLGLVQHGDHLVLTFADTGSGIEAKDLPHIFEPFYTTRGTLMGGDQKSAGLGLSVVHGIVRECGGTIEIRSRHHEGTTFTIRLPIRGKT
ncbi:MAG: PAS domain-containing protein [Sedimentisphaerales bacterium]|nr:PAS domain-containing protein [Sedimentisphaerales bacterium]